MSAKKVIQAIASKVLGPRGVDYLRLTKYSLKAEREYAAWLRKPGSSDIRQRLRELKDIHRGRRCFVIGNGPSLNQMDLGPLKGEITIGCNGLFLLFDKLGWVPTYYTVEDKLVAEDRGQKIAEIANTVKVVPLDLAAKVPDPNVLWINFVRDYPGFPKFSTNFPARAYWGGTVTYLNIQLAVHLGCNPIYLIGVDHNYKTDFAIQREGSKWTSMESDPNHFHPDYFGKGFRWHDPNVDRMEQCYREAHEVCSQMSIRIVNATVGGRLEVFPREAYTTLF